MLCLLIVSTAQHSTAQQVESINQLINHLLLTSTQTHPDTPKYTREKHSFIKCVSHVIENVLLALFCQSECENETKLLNQ